MSFYTSLTGLNAATAQLGVTANNIANVSTVGFKRSRADFGDIFATSPLQKASSTIGQGVSLKKVTQEFGQGNMTFSSNTLDLAISGDGFFPLKSQDGFQDIFTRNGSFMMNDQYNVVNSAGQRLMAASVDSSGKANLTDMNVLTIPQKTTGMATQTSKVQLGLNFPADAPVITSAFNRNDATTYNKSTALTVYDGGGNGYLATVYYVKTQNASQETPNNKWQTFVYVGDQLVDASLQQATNKTGDVMYVNKYGELKAKEDFKTPDEIAALNSSFSKKTYKFSLDQLNDVRTSQPAAVTGGSATGLGTGTNDGIDFNVYSTYTKATLVAQQGLSSATYAMPAATSYTAGDKFQVQIKNGTPIEITSATASSLPTPNEVVTALNANTDFAKDYVASLDSSGAVFLNSKAPNSANSLATDVAMKIVPATGTPKPVTSTAGLAPLATPNTLLAGKKSFEDLKDLFKINIDNSIDPVSVGLERLAGKDVKLSGAQIAAELTNAINRAYGDEKPFNFDTTTGVTFSLQLPQKLPSTGPKLDITLKGEGNLRYEDLVAKVQSQIDTKLAVVNAGQPTGQKYGVTVSYDTKAQKLVFKPAGNDKISVMSDQTSIRPTNDPITQGVNDDTVGLTLTPSVSAASFRASNDQRFGATVEYDAVKGGFVFKSGTTGDASSITLSDIKAGSLATVNDRGLGLTGDPATYAVGQSKIDALRGIASKPAVLNGNALAVNVDNNFAVDTTNNQFVVSVNGVTGTVVVPPKDTYTLSTFMEALQSGINNLQGPSVDGATPQTVDGVKVTYDTKTNALKFTTGTASTSSYIKVTGDARWGLDGLDAKFGTTTTWIKPTPFKDDKNATVYIDGFGKESSTATGFDNLPEWSPVYFDKGELTFDTAGNLVSPKQGAQLDTVYLPNGKGSLTINIDYSKSTQFASPYAVLSQSQDGAPEGDLVGLAVKDDGLVNASYSNGAQKSLGKVVLVNFSNPTGLRQIGDTSYYKTSDSGTPKYGEAGSAGYGTVRSGATERANVDLTQELVDLITEQRNFQANAKAIETSTSLTSTIIQIRN
ncbi:flagellar hook-basal body complex protein [Limnohabitans sp. B9-3]|uniref:flagellar hook-basal body complex protein n=1 Tax=Limnohabitans sp. B9-3 TaxID=1100707 RepID=UPI000C1E4587|nr:flagellar hook-basal body complex protein [Limnohabitans sp. B9-3]PIT72028.1 hypothetical protein B9Z42_14105 [Limnohabitans sp. B9-3]